MATCPVEVGSAAIADAESFVPLDPGAMVEIVLREQQGHFGGVLVANQYPQTPGVGKTGMAKGQPFRGKLDIVLVGQAVGVLSGSVVHADVVGRIGEDEGRPFGDTQMGATIALDDAPVVGRSEEHTSELQS